MSDIREKIKGLTAEEAIEVLDAYLAQHADDEEAYIARGLKHWSAGHRGLAINDYLSAIRLNPESRANEALRAANEILDYRNKDLYNP